SAPTTGRRCGPTCWPAADRRRYSRRPGASIWTTTGTPQQPCAKDAGMLPAEPCSTSSPAGRRRDDRSRSLLYACIGYVWWGDAQIMKEGPRHLVAAGYDRIADAYLDRYGASSVRWKWLGRLMDSLPSGGGRVLDLG